MCVVMKYFGSLFSVLNIALTTNKALLVPPEVLLIIDEPSSFRNFLVFLSAFITPLKWCLKYPNFMSVSHKISVLITKQKI